MTTENEVDARAGERARVARVERMKKRNARYGHKARGERTCDEECEEEKYFINERAMRDVGTWYFYRTMEMYDSTQNVSHHTRALASHGMAYVEGWYANARAGEVVVRARGRLPVPVVVPLSLLTNGVRDVATVMHGANTHAHYGAQFNPHGFAAGYGSRWDGSYRSRARARGRRVDGNGSKHTVYVKEVHVSVTEAELAALFEGACGRVLDCRLCGDAGSDKFRYAFVALESDEAVLKALALHGADVHGHALTVLKSETPVIPVNPLLLPKTEQEIESCSRTIYVSNVDKSVNESALQKLCEDCAGAVSRLHIQAKTHALANVAFVEFVEAKSAGKALQLTGRRLGNRSIRVNPSKTPLRTMRKSQHRKEPVDASTPLEKTSRDDEGSEVTSIATDDAGDEKNKHVYEEVAEDAPVNKVYVSNIPKNMSPGTLRALFAECGGVADIELLNHPKSKFPYAFIDFEDIESTTKALAMNGKEIENCALTVQLTKNTRHRPRMTMSLEQREKAERTIYVTDIDPELNATYVRDRFEEECGAISLYWFKLFEKGLEQAIAYVEFVEQSSVDKALSFCRTHFLSDKSLVKIRYSRTALRARDDDDGECYTPELDSPRSDSSASSPKQSVDDENGKDSVVRDLSRLDEMSACA